MITNMTSSDPIDHAQFPAETDPRGSFERAPSRFRERISRDGSTRFPAQPGRYHLFVSYACPWAHRTIIARRLKRLEDVVGLTSVHPLRDERGWRFVDEVDPRQWVSSS